MARPEQVLLLEPQHELKFRGKKRGGPGFDGRGGADASPRGVCHVRGGMVSGQRGAVFRRPDAGKYERSVLTNGSQSCKRTALL